MAPNSTTSIQPRKRRNRNLPTKPYKDFHLTAHPSGFWCKKIAAKMHYFGRWGRTINKKVVKFEGEEWKSSWKAAKALYDSQSEEFKAGLVQTIVRPEDIAAEAIDDKKCTLAILCFKFMEDRKDALEAGEIGLPMFNEYMALCQTLLRVLGADREPSTLGPADLQKLRRQFASRLGATRLKNCIIWTRTIFTFAYDTSLIENPIRCLKRSNKVFQPPKARVARLERAKKPKQMLKPAECRTLIEAAPAPLKAWILLGLNCGFGPMDCAQLPLAAIDFKNSTIDYPRPKTGVQRRAFLWKETITAIREAIAVRPVVKLESAKDLLFITGIGRSFVGVKTGKANQISVMIRKLMVDTGVHQEGFGGYTFRHVFETVAGDTKDQIAVDSIMGHVDDSMGARYRQEITDERLQAVSDYVHRWLFAKKKPR